MAWVLCSSRHPLKESQNTDPCQRPGSLVLSASSCQTASEQSYRVRTYGISSDHTTVLLLVLPSLTKHMVQFQ